jgi:serine/threonine-protein kinase TNNI3K
MEVKYQSSVKHKNILRIHGCFFRYPKLGILMDYCVNSDLGGCISGKKIMFSNQQKFDILIGIASGMAYLHKNKIIHRDLKPGNVLLNKDYIPKICDFGLSRASAGCGSVKTSRRGSSYYMAPEVVTSEHYDNKCDVFSFSMIMYEVIWGKIGPFEHRVLQNIELKMANDPNMRPKLDKIKDKTTTGMIQLIEECWNNEPRTRPEFKYINKVLGKEKTTGNNFIFHFNRILTKS